MDGQPRRWRRRGCAIPFDPRRWRTLRRSVVSFVSALPCNSRRTRCVSRGRLPARHHFASRHAMRLQRQIPGVISLRIFLRQRISNPALLDRTTAPLYRERTLILKTPCKYSAVLTDHTHALALFVFHTRSKG